MTIDDINKVLVFLKVKGLLEVQYLDVKESKMIHKGIQLYDYKSKKFISIDDVIALAKKSGYPQ
jgi:hypothetical protein|tara:strand:- start:91 stop:282 length:192 start_codon:yes stop_codon:yes gene_type:complete